MTQISPTIKSHNIIGSTASTHAIKDGDEEDDERVRI